MTDRSKDKQKTPGGKKERDGGSREDRLRAALRANLARRKVQSRARSETSQGNGPTDKDDTGGVDN